MSIIARLTQTYLIFVLLFQNYYRGVVELEKHNLIRLTNKKHIIVINHNDIFLGNFNRFCELYNDIYGDMEVAVDGRGRIIL